MRETHAIDTHAISTAQIAQPPVGTVQEEHGVAAGDIRVLQPKIAVVRTTDEKGLRQPNDPLAVN